MFGACGIVEVAGTAVGVTVTLGAPEAITVPRCDPTQIAVATPVPNWSSLRREIDVAKTVSVECGDCSQSLPLAIGEPLSDPCLFAVPAIFPIPRARGQLR
jgi:hypothetical protein